MDNSTLKDLQFEDAKIALLEVIKPLTDKVERLEKVVLASRANLLTYRQVQEEYGITKERLKRQVLKGAIKPAAFNWTRFNRVDIENLKDLLK